VKAAENNSEWIRAGKNLLYQVQGKVVVLKFTTEMPEGGWPESSTGKSFVVSSSQGFTMVDEVPGLSINVTAVVRKR